MKDDEVEWTTIDGLLDFAERKIMRAKGPFITAFRQAIACIWSEGALGILSGLKIEVGLRHENFLQVKLTNKLISIMFEACLQSN